MKTIAYFCTNTYLNIVKADIQIVRTIELYDTETHYAASNVFFRWEIL